MRLTIVFETIWRYEGSEAGRLPRRERYVAMESVETDLKRS
jgi:hypothetical protein